MSNQQHTPEPWKYTFDGTHPQDGDLEYVEVTPVGDDDLVILSSCSCCQGLSCSKADIERIIACVNACKGINPEGVPDLLAALERCATQLALGVLKMRGLIDSEPKDLWERECHDEVDPMVEAAIAKAKPCKPPEST